MRTVPSLLSILALTAGCTSTPSGPRHAQITEDVTVQAKVVSVDAATREVTLDDGEGMQFVVVAGPEVRNFDQIQTGDKVKAQYVQSLSARILESSEADTDPYMAMGAGRAEAGERPAGAIEAGFTMTVKVESVDRNKHLVVFTDPANEPHVVRAQRDEGKRFVEGLKPGDRVELTYAEAVGVKIEE